jgi:hypothetical protein
MHSYSLFLDCKEKVDECSVDFASICRRRRNQIPDLARRMLFNGTWTKY